MRENIITERQQIIRLGAQLSVTRVMVGCTCGALLVVVEADGPHWLLTLLAAVALSAVTVSPLVNRLLWGRPQVVATGQRSRLRQVAQAKLDEQRRRQALTLLDNIDREDGR